MTPHELGILAADQNNVPAHLKQAYARGFAGALEKRAISDHTLVYTGAGGVLGALVGLIRQLRAGKEFQQQSERTDLNRIPTDAITDLPVLRTKDDIRKHLSRLPFDFRFTKLDNKSPWAFYLDKKMTKGRPAYILPGDRVIENVYLHERGHKEQDVDPNSVKRRPVISALSGLLLGTKRTPMYHHEVDAWERAGVPENDPLRRAALKTYARVFDLPRFAAGGALAGLALSHIMRKPNKRM